jgi:L-methionine (R)-S-oxide reductase
MTLGESALSPPGPFSYASVLAALDSLVKDERDAVANLANAAALLFCTLPDLNWAGFYLLKRPPSADVLVLGPFQGLPACIRIPLGKGVCGTAAVARKTVLVPDVHAFPGHIACDSKSRSELVVPLLSPAGALLGVLDLDSPKLARFSEQDARALEQFCERVVRACDWT